MFKKVAKAIVFLLVGGWLFFQASYLCRKDIYNTTRARAGFYALKKDTLDVCIIGTSGTLSAFCPMQAWKSYGFTSYNFCVNRMGADTFSYAIREVLKTQKPNVFLIDVLPFVQQLRVGNMDMDDEIDIRCNVDGYRYSLNRFRLIHNVVPAKIYKIPFYFDILKYGSGNLDFSLMNFACNDFKKGYSNFEWEEAHPAVRSENCKALGTELEKDLEDLFQYCKSVKSNDISFIFMFFPYGNIKEDSIENLNWIKLRASEMGFSFWDCENSIEEFNLDYMLDFWGELHWNIFGAEKITSVVAWHLHELFHFDDKRNEKKYERWNEDLIDWEKYVNKEKEYILSDKEKKIGGKTIY